MIERDENKTKEELRLIEQNATCQACFVHHEHERCTGENTLGTRPLFMCGK